MMRIGIVCAWALAAATAEACSCGDVPLQVHFRYSSAVFAAKVLAVNESRERGYSGILASVEVSEAWKGVRNGERVIIATGHGGGDCGVQFSPDSTYLVFAEPTLKKGRLTTSICHFTQRMSSQAPVDTLRAWAWYGRVPPDPPGLFKKSKLQ